MRGFDAGFRRLFISLVKARRTVRSPFLHKRISRRDLRFILEAGRWAPSGHNAQPWEFIFVEDRGLKEKIGESTRRVYEELLGDEEKFKATFGSYGRWIHRNPGRKDGIYVEPTALSDRGPNRLNLDGLKIRAEEYCRLVSEAPALLITLLDRERAPPNMSRGLISLISVGAALQNIRLAAKTLGVGCQDLARPIDTVEGEKRLKRILRVPERFKVVSVMRLGYLKPGAAHPYKSNFRRPLKSLIHFDAFTQPANDAGGKMPTEP